MIKRSTIRVYKVKKKFKQWKYWGIILKIVYINTLRLINNPILAVNKFCFLKLNFIKFWKCKFLYKLLLQVVVTNEIKFVGFEVRVIYKMFI